MMASLANNYTENIADQLNFGIEEEVCAFCGEKFQIRKYKGESFETIHTECKLAVGSVNNENFLKAKL